MCVDVMRRLDEHKTRMQTLAARWKMLTVDACHFMLCAVLWVVDYAINARLRNRVSRFENIANVCHVVPPGVAELCYSPFGSSSGVSAELIACGFQTDPLPRPCLNSRYDPSAS